MRWVDRDPTVKSWWLTDAGGAATAAVDLNPWGGETGRSWQPPPRRFTTYERDGNGNDYATFRQYHGGWHRFAQPAPYDGSRELSDPQSRL